MHECDSGIVRGRASRGPLRTRRLLRTRRPLQTRRPRDVLFAQGRPGVPPGGSARLSGPIELRRDTQKRNWDSHNDTELRVTLALYSINNFGGRLEKVNTEDTRKKKKGGL